MFPSLNDMMSVCVCVRVCTCVCTWLLLQPTNIIASYYQSFPPEVSQSYLYLFQTCLPLRASHTVSSLVPRPLLLPSYHYQQKTWVSIHVDQATKNKPWISPYQVSHKDGTQYPDCMYHYYVTLISDNFLLSVIQIIHSKFRLQSTYKHCSVRLLLIMQTLRHDAYLSVYKGHPVQRPVLLHAFVYRPSKTQIVCPVLNENYIVFVYSPGSCETLESAQCDMVLPYSVSLYPNSMGHMTPTEAELASFEFLPLLAMGCSPVNLPLFVCSLHFPSCGDAPVLPCSELCRAAMTECSVFILGIQHVWPEKAQCSNFPSMAEGTCIPPQGQLACYFRLIVNATNTIFLGSVVPLSQQRLGEEEHFYPIESQNNSTKMLIIHNKCQCYIIYK